jgi:hypothetical protein
VPLKPEITVNNFELSPEGAAEKILEVIVAKKR